ncbi:transmembrane protein 198-like [Corythoichthys intestinalis]|uniref:transmembrane protein 198-like n=1 Tax=Corythoichthys intestinalis TaxID=161448 RepID=UPI0025A5D1C3|nr:transmembrane protein 198-like [Corythoichthys intestinalis]XP_057686256.1 transmembrane protein 198-like [Corythoichthys intestinalis]XP_061802717.1 transmembrane protein 198-like [Nerophis lumbriciformis]
MAFVVIDATDEPLARLDECMLEIYSGCGVVPSVVCFICLLFGFIYCFLGYRCFKMIIFFSGFLSGSASVFWLYHIKPVSEAHTGTETKAGIILGVGVLCGLASLLVTTLGLLLCGLQLSGLFCCATLVIFSQFHNVVPTWMPLSVIMASSVCAAVLALRWQRLFIITYTSAFGATTVMLCVDYFVGAFMLLDQVYDMFSQKSPLPLCWFNWATTGIGPLLGAISMLAQWKCTAKGVFHTESMLPKKKKPAKKHKYKECRRRPQHYRQRRPPLLKRYAGDVLAPSHLQSLRERQEGKGSSTDNISTVTHMLIEFETGSVVPLNTYSPACMV